MRRFALLVLLLAAPLRAEDPFGNADVVALVQLGLDEAVVVAKIQQAPQVAFALDTRDLVALKDAGVPAGVITAMLQRSATATSAVSDAAVRVGDAALTRSAGMTRYENRMYALVTYQDITGLESRVRLKEQRPTFLIRSSAAPEGAWFLAAARPYPKKGVREIKTGTVSAFGAGSVMRPHDAWVIPYTTEPAGDGLWKLTPAEELGGGEFVLWQLPGQDPGVFVPQIYDFAVDGFDPAPRKL